MINSTSKKIGIISALSLVLFLTGCSIFNKQEGVIDTGMVNENLTGIDNLPNTGEILSGELETKTIDSGLEQKIDELIEKHKEENTDSTGLTENDINLIDSVINEIAQSVDAEDTGASK